MKIKNKEIENILKLLKDNSAFLVTSHQDPDGDSVGSLIGLTRFLKLAGKSAIAYSQGRIPEKYHFLGSEEEIRNIPERPPYLPEVAIVLECPSYDRIGFVKDLINPEMTIINIDHHKNNDLYGNINYVDTEACAVGEMLYDIIEESGLDIPVNVATPLYSAIASDTGGFKFTNTNAKCLRTAAKLVEWGANPNLISGNLFGSIAPQTMRLCGTLMGNFELFDNGQICVLKLSHDVLTKTGASIENSEGVIDNTMTIAGVKVGILFKEFDQHTTKVSLRSQNGIDVCVYAKTKGGGGHQNAAGFTMYEPFDSVVKNIIGELTEYLHG